MSELEKVNFLSSDNIFYYKIGLTLFSLFFYVVQQTMPIIKKGIIYINNLF